MNNSLSLRSFPNTILFAKRAKMLLWKRFIIYVKVGSITIKANRAESKFCSNISSPSVEKIFIASWFNQIYFATLRPGAIFQVFGQQPNSWPQPVTLWHFGFNLQTPITEWKRLGCSKSSWLDWIDNILFTTLSQTPILFIPGAGVSWAMPP